MVATSLDLARSRLICPDVLGQVLRVVERCFERASRLLVRLDVVVRGARGCGSLAIRAVLRSAQLALYDPDLARSPLTSRHLA